MQLTQGSRQGSRASNQRGTAVLFDEEQANKFEKEGSFDNIEGFNPDEEGIDPVTIYRF